MVMFYRVGKKLYSADKTDYFMWELLSGNEMFDHKCKQREVSHLYWVFLLFSSFLFFASSVFPPWICSLKWYCYSRWLGAIWRTDKRNTSLKIWKYVSMRTYFHPLKLHPGIEKNNKCVCACMKDQRVCLCICTELRCEDFKHMSACFLETSMVNHI